MIDDKLLIQSINKILFAKEEKLCVKLLVFTWCYTKTGHAFKLEIEIESTFWTLNMSNN